ncbi:MAG: hypothetical protein H7326_11805 [Bdellovibrionaceae bacterium]|nr:hypothetical protein [Pseudobdellovibrionaceae bacterium]
MLPLFVLNFSLVILAGCGQKSGGGPASAATSPKVDDSHGTDCTTIWTAFIAKVSAKISQ